MTGFSKRVREIITERAGGSCERCGRRTWDMQVHHRRPRGAGGSRRPETNQAANGVLLDGDCHRGIESNRTAALSDGWLVAQCDTPATVPVFRRGVYVWLNDDGSITHVRPDEPLDITEKLTILRAYTELSKGQA